LQTISPVKSLCFVAILRQELLSENNLLTFSLKNCLYSLGFLFKVMSFKVFLPQSSQLITSI
jgi:hypothetical protein